MAGQVKDPYRKLGDFWTSVLLFFLYWLQGAIFGFFTYTLPIIFAERGVPLPSLTPFTFTYYPYTGKVFLAPFVDSYYSPTFGKRKTYVIPVHYTISALFLVGSLFIQTLIDS